MLKILKFNPFFRLSASELLKCKLFDSVRDKEMERSAPYKIQLDVDRENSFDYELGHSKKFVLKDYQKIIIKEAL